MKYIRTATFLLLVLFNSCKKESTQTHIIGLWNWTIQYAGNPAYNSTPLSTGIKETLSFNGNGNYSLAQNGIVTNSGTYRTSNAISTSGQIVMSVLYNNLKVKDSAAYYLLTNNNDSLIFSHDLIGSVGSGSRHYSRQ